MPYTRLVQVTPSLYSELNAHFEHYLGDIPEQGFPTFLESLLFDHHSRSPAPRRRTQSPSHARGRGRTARITPKT